MTISKNIRGWLDDAMEIDRRSVRRLREAAARTADPNYRAALYMAADRLDDGRDALLRELNAQKIEETNNGE